MVAPCRTHVNRLYACISSLRPDTPGNIIQNYVRGRTGIQGRKEGDSDISPVELPLSERCLQPAALVIGPETLVLTHSHPNARTKKWVPDPARRNVTVSLYRPRRTFIYGTPHAEHRPSVLLLLLLLLLWCSCYSLFAFVCFVSSLSLLLSLLIVASVGLITAPHTIFF